MVNGVGYHLRVPSKMIIIKNLDDQDHFDDLDDDDQDVNATTGAKRLLEIIIKNLDDQDHFDHDDDDQDVDDNDQDQDPGSLC